MKPRRPRREHKDLDAENQHQILFFFFFFLFRFDLAPPPYSPPIGDRPRELERSASRSTIWTRRVFVRRTGRWRIEPSKEQLDSRLVVEVGVPHLEVNAGLLFYIPLCGQLCWVIERKKERQRAFCSRASFDGLLEPSFSSIGWQVIIVPRTDWGGPGLRGDKWN